MPLLFWYDKTHICQVSHYREFVFGRRVLRRYVEDHHNFLAHCRNSTHFNRYKNGKVVGGVWNGIEGADEKGKGKDSSGSVGTDEGTSSSSVASGKGLLEHWHLPYADHCSVAAEVCGVNDAVETGAGEEVGLAAARRSEGAVTAAAEGAAVRAVDEWDSGVLETREVLRTAASPPTLPATSAHGNTPPPPGLACAAEGYFAPIPSAVDTSCKVEKQEGWRSFQVGTLFA